MKNKIRIAYEILVIFIIIFVIITGLFIKSDVVNFRSYGEVSIFTNYEHQWIEDASLYCGGKDVVTFTIDDKSCADTDITFYSVHQDVDIYIDDQIVYSVKSNTDNLFAKTPGNLWISIRLFSKDIGKQIRIEFTPVYKSAVGEIPKIYIGNAIEIIIHQFKNSIFTAVIAFATFILGAYFMIWVVYNKANSYIDRSLFYLASFALFIGLWKLFDLDIMSLLLDNSILVSFMPLLSLVLVIVPFTLFLGELFTADNKWKYNILCVLSLIYGFAVVVLQVLGIYDLREGLLINHILMGMLIVIGISGSIIEIKNTGWSKTIKLNSMCIVICFIGTIADLSIYYTSSDETVSCFGIMGFLVYITILGFANIKENKRLMEEGKKAEKYQDIAYHDSLTKMYTRSAFQEFTDPADFNPEGAIMIMCDLNNLKKCNDTYGHEAGDRYLIESSKLILKVFEGRGKCFRMGGDEFAVIVMGSNLEQCKIFVEELRREQEKYRTEYPNEYPIWIACGYAKFDKNLDKDFNETLRRADKFMYADKFNIKKARGEEMR